MKNRKIFKKREIIAVAILLAAAVAALLFLPKKQGNTAVVVYDGTVVLELSLNRDGIYTVAADLPVTLEIQDGKIRFIHSVCPDHLCEGYGFIGEDFESAVCMPAKTAVQIRSAS